MKILFKLSLGIFVNRFFFFLLIFAFDQINFKVECISVRVSNLTIGQTSYNLISSSIEDIYRVVYNSTNTTLNVTAWTNATNELPLLIVIRQENGLISLQLPNKETSKFVQNVSRILCPAYVRRDSTGLSTVYIDIYTSSQTNISYTLQVNYFESFVLNELSTTNIFVSPFAPVFFKYNMNSESSIVKFTSKDKICTTVSVQRMMCPVFDLKHTIDFAGQYQTMTRLASISVHNPDFKFKTMYIVISVHPTDKDCCDSANCSKSAYHRIKNITVELNPGYDHSQVNLNYAITLSIFLAIYVFICPFLCFVEPYSEKNLKTLIDEMQTTETILSLSTSVTPASNNRLYEILNEKNRPQSTKNNTDISSQLISKKLVQSHLDMKIEKFLNSDDKLKNLIANENKKNFKIKEDDCHKKDLNEKLLSLQIDKRYDENLISKSSITETINSDLIKQPNQSNNQINFNLENDPESENFYADKIVDLTITSISSNQATCPINEDNTLVNEDNSFSSIEYDKVEDSMEYKEVVRNKPNLKLHDLARKKPKLLDRKIMNYPRLIVAIATFYVLPVVQLVLLYQTQLTKTGNEDSCYFNFLCMIKSGPFAAFNNIFSNVGYILLGIMFIIVVKKRAYSYTYMRKKYPVLMATHGVPQHFGLFYTMGIGLVMEGILSAAYHVCPSYNNFQFDTSFMYIIGVISTIKLYQSRHPDIHPSSQKVFLFLALCILINVIGVFYGKTQTWFVVTYSISHIIFFFCLSVIVYYMKQPKLGLSSFKKIAQNFKQNRSLKKPNHIERLIMLIIANVFNIGLAVYAILVPNQFSSHLLNVLLGNFMLYFIMYLISKVIHKEKFHIITILNLIVSSIAWIAALYFFSIEIKHWEKKPAESREANRECILLNVYDHHDAWHFLSALSMFMSFVVMLTLDDGIINKKRTEIAVF